MWSISKIFVQLDFSSSQLACTLMTTGMKNSQEELPERAHLVSAVTSGTIDRQLERSIYSGSLQGLTFVSNAEGGRDFAP